MVRHGPQWLRAHGDFTPNPPDSLLKVYSLAEEDLDVDIIMDILKKLNCGVPDQATVDAIGAINTPADVVRFVEASCSRSVTIGNQRRWACRCLKGIEVSVPLNLFFAIQQKGWPVLRAGWLRQRPFLS